MDNKRNQNVEVNANQKSKYGVVGGKVLFAYGKSRDNAVARRFNRRHFDINGKPSPDSPTSEPLQMYIQWGDLVNMFADNNLSEEQRKTLKQGITRASIAYYNALEQVFYEMDKIRFGETIADELQNYI